MIDAHVLHHRMTISLSTRLKAATKLIHAEVERTNFVTRLLGGTMSRTAYCALLRNLHPIYVGLEDGIREHRGDPVIAPLADPALARTSALVQDLCVLHGPRWETEIALAAAACDYAAHLRHLGGHQPTLLAAHAYVRYLGDLSGGQQLSRMVRVAFGGDGGDVTTFYDFGGPTEVVRLAAEIRAALDRIATTESQAQSLIDEATAGFERHRDLFRELARAHPS